jgi:hypothetical protein
MRASSFALMSQKSANAAAVSANNKAPSSIPIVRCITRMILQKPREAPADCTTHIAASVHRLGVC